MTAVAAQARSVVRDQCATSFGNAVVYSALTEPGDTIMSIAQPLGGHSSNRADGPAGAHGLKIVDLPMDPVELVVNFLGDWLRDALNPKLR